MGQANQKLLPSSVFLRRLSRALFHLGNYGRVGTRNFSILVQDNDLSFLAERASNAGLRPGYCNGQITEQSYARHDSAILGNWPYTIGSMKLAKGPRTFMGKVAHLLRVYRIVS